MTVGVQRKDDSKQCEDCGAWMSKIPDRRFDKGYRWRCPNCEAC